MEFIGCWCRRSPNVKQIVIASSDKAYGDQETLPYSENTPLQGRHPYDVSKSAADLIANTYAASFDLPIAITRCGNFYGGGDLNWNRIIPGTIRSILRRQNPIIRSTANTSAITFMWKMARRPTCCSQKNESWQTQPGAKGQTFNFSNEIQVTVSENRGTHPEIDELGSQTGNPGRDVQTKSAINISAPKKPGGSWTGIRFSRWRMA